jgi:hypothetical protein
MTFPLFRQATKTLGASLGATRAEADFRQKEQPTDSREPLASAASALILRQTPLFRHSAIESKGLPAGNRSALPLA